MADYSVRLIRSQSYTVTQERTIVTESTPQSDEIYLSELADVSVPDRASQNRYVLSYNASTQKYELVSADEILTIAASDTEVPQAFVETLQTELDNEIDLDGGSF